MKVLLNLCIEALDYRYSFPHGIYERKLRYPYLLEQSGRHSLPVGMTASVDDLQSEKHHDVGDHLAVLIENISADISDIRGLRHIHSQCTINDNFLGSRCLRIHHEHGLPCESIAIDQVGTAGIGASLMLLGLSRSQGCVLLTCADQWLSPFTTTSIEGFSYQDACGALFLGSSFTDQTIATIEWISSFSGHKSESHENLFQSFSIWLSRLVRDKASSPDLVIGEAYPTYLTKHIGSVLTVSNVAPARSSHEASAAAIASIVEGSKSLQNGGRALIWSLSLSGHGYAFFVDYNKRKER
ncbi:hypothetical protein [Pseudobacteriovorax antillogorgiicola]|uniref:Uncharacterized protein n=1 Tax=Pseudobacteriovorax antillogorgiicola TaxID=1513793 RepID=A0A1Y6C0Q5_9BACT|nr:hypothetical protein [Pseudobacteriovorax antillogorgiicola]TCS51198.1 hypothetical protein EDD56_11182 [Pseudobacteriovorax antillogorgiicola]SMF37463.1 hypothetical protein SAMN06296036_11196 [Pseudobacteriovorax antillogorgiicola]